MLLREIADPDDSDLIGVARLLATTFADPNTVLDLDRLREFVSLNRSGGARRFHVLVASEPGGDGLIGATVFSYVGASNCGLSEYIVVSKPARGRGTGRLLFDERRAVLDRDARLHDRERCHGLFIEVDHPEHTPPELLEAEQETALDAWQRWRIFDHFGFRRVDLAYVQPPLADAKTAVDYLALMFLPWDAAARRSARIPRDWVLETLQPIWMGWAPRRYLSFFETLQRQLPAGEIDLKALLHADKS
jgi:GNAT superfamily N-acetyltransferase